MVNIGNISDVIIRQYPHWLYKRTDTESVQDDNGSWTDSGEPIIEFCGACREETNGKGSRIQAADGEFIEFSSLVLMPVEVQRITEGTTIFVTEEEITDPAQLLDSTFVEQAKAEGIIRITGECLKFDGGRLHHRMWI
jgi:hypothetical protein